MRKLITSVMFGMALFFSQSILAQGINFEAITLKEALAKASKPANKKFILVDCYTTWCIPCIQMANEEFPKKIAGDYFNPKFVSVKFDMEKGEGKEHAKKYGVQAYPTFLILDAEGNELNRVVGKSTAEEFIEKVKTALDPKNSISGLKTAYEADKNFTTGKPYALALYQSSKDPAPVLEELFERVMDYERFSPNYLELALGTVKFGSPFFRKMMMYKMNMDQAMGTEVINRIIFDKVRKDMYSIAMENGARYNVFYTPEEVEDVVYTIGLLKLSPDLTERHICHAALYVSKKDLDGLIAYYNRYIWSIPSGDVFRGILDGILSNQVAKASAAQKTAIRAYFEKSGKFFEKEGKRSLSQAESIK